MGRQRRSRRRVRCNLLGAKTRTIPALRLKIMSACILNRAHTIPSWNRERCLPICGKGTVPYRCRAEVSKLPDEHLDGVRLAQAAGGLRTMWTRVRCHAPVGKWDVALPALRRAGR